MYSKGLAPLAAATVVTLTAAFTMVFFYAPNDADQGFVQKIFYVHVPMAIVALCGFVAGGIMAIKHLRSGDASWDLRSYVAIHMSIILGVGVLATGAKPSASRRSLNSGGAMISAIARWRRSMISRGVPVGTPTPENVLTSNSGMVSRASGTSGTAGERAVGSSAIARTAPDLMCGSEFGKASTATCT